MKKILNISIYICTENILYIQYMFIYVPSQYELLLHNIIECIYGHYLTLMACTKWGKLFTLMACTEERHLNFFFHWRDLLTVLL